MKKLLTVMAVLLTLGAGQVFAAESRASIIIDEQTTQCYVYNSTGVKVVSYIHYSSYGAPSSSATNQVISNAAQSVKRLSGTSTPTVKTFKENNNKTAGVTVSYDGNSSTHRHYYY